MQDLIERLEKAAGPDRILDGLIFKLVEERPGDMWTDDFAHGVWHRRDPQDHVAFDTPPYYTQSIDTALTLLPEWASFELTRSAAGEPTFTRCRVWDWRRGPLALDPHNEWKSEDGNRPLPINICIAALKARR